MTEKLVQQVQSETTVSEVTDTKKDWQEPKVAFVKPKLNKHGSVKEMTGGFFGTFIPD